VRYSRSPGVPVKPLLHLSLLKAFRKAFFYLLKIQSA
jgi:hypothetical protein